MSRISENQLILPSLYIFSSSEIGLTTSELLLKLTTLFNPSGEDAAILSGRSDSKFSQIVRNLKSHDTFEREGFAKFEDGVYKINDLGRAYLAKHRDAVEYLFDNNFDFEDLKESLDKLNQGIVEDKEPVKTSKVFQRSSKLRKFAIDRFKTEEGIFCEVCNFNFYKIYGNLGRDFIEIHHKKPIFTFDQIDFDQTLETALINLSPLCANCHRMIHRNSNELSVERLKKLIESQSTIS